ncbi:MAG: hypothetical protein MJ078_02810, partial [Clostridia bacterium]|nr:hypothetical protein [Clostridia bacterium]
MKKRVLAFFLAAMFVFVLAYPILAKSTSATFMADGKTVSNVNVVGGELILPDAVALEGKKFVGWEATISGKTVLYPAGASVRTSGNTEWRAVGVALQTNTGATVRLKDGEVGLRFTTNVNKADYQYLRTVAGSENVTMHTMISDWRNLVLCCGNVFTIENFQTIGCPYLDAKAGGFYAETQTDYVFAGSVTNILPNNYTRMYAGIGYLEIIYSNGETGRVYSSYRYQDNARILYSVVLSAYNDRSAEYPYGQTDGSRSPYTQEELALMKEYLDHAVSVKFAADYTDFYAEGGRYYTSPWVVTFGKEDTQKGTIPVTVTAPAGMTLSDLRGIMMGGT